MDPASVLKVTELIQLRRPSLVDLQIKVLWTTVVTWLGINFCAIPRWVSISTYLFAILGTAASAACTVFPAYSDTLGTSEKCHSKQVSLKPHHFYLQRSCQVNGSISLSVRRRRRPYVPSSVLQYIRDMYGILRTLGHLDILAFVSCDFPGNVTSWER